MSGRRLQCFWKDCVCCSVTRWFTTRMIDKLERECSVYDAKGFLNLSMIFFCVASISWYSVSMCVEAIMCSFMSQNQTHNLMCPCVNTHARKLFICFCVLCYQQDYNSTTSHPRKVLEDFLHVGIWISTNLADIQIRIWDSSHQPV